MRKRLGAQSSQLPVYSLCQEVDPKDKAANNSECCQCNMRLCARKLLQNSRQSLSQGATSHRATSCHRTTADHECGAADSWSTVGLKPSLLTTRALRVVPYRSAQAQLIQVMWTWTVWDGKKGCPALPA
eukprot:1161622-Pelagomonas_calceolata.AAC.14